MMPETKAHIAALPEDAPASAVLAAWAGKDFNLFDYTKNVVSYEPTLRRWLLDGGVRIYERRNNVRYICSLSDVGVFELNGLSTDSPDAAFDAACEQFAAALRKESK